MNYIKGKNYQVTKDEWVELPFDVPKFNVADGLVYTWGDDSRSRVLRVKKGWTWDGASFVLFRWFWTPQRWITPSLYHDALYEAIRRGIVGRECRERIDRFFRDELIKRGVSHAEAQLAYWCVRIGGNFAVRKDVIEREVV
jgi:hypothetical protein